MFEKAIRLKLRFETSIGMLSVEDLWDLPLTHATKVSLDSIAAGLHKQLNEENVISFVNPSETNKLTQLKFDIVLHILNVMKKDTEERVAARDRKAKKEQLMQLIAQKENEQLTALSLDDLKKMAESL